MFTHEGGIDVGSTVDASYARGSVFTFYLTPKFIFIIIAVKVIVFSIASHLVVIIFELGKRK